MAKRYQPSIIEPKWQVYWESNNTFKTIDDFSKPKFYALDMFPYPSGKGLHVGHPEGYTATDIISRYKRMKGFNVLHPMGWDAFGLPAEQHALETGGHPETITRENINNFRRQLKSLGLSYDWDREIATVDADYYKWTQWIFLKLYERGLAYIDKIPVNWCEALGTVLANEEVIDGKSERGNHPVVRVPMKQWVLRITAYADRLLYDLEDLNWPESVKEMQKNWIGRSEGAEIIFKIESFDDEIIVFTTRPDTLFGATYLVLSPEHQLVEKITSKDRKNDTLDYQKQAMKKNDLERTDLAKEKTGVFIGAYAINPVNGNKIPIWIADYVLNNYGTGAVMAVPAHDLRDYDFAKTYQLPFLEVVSGGDISNAAHVTDGVLVNSDFINGLNISEAKSKMIEWLEESKNGKKKVQYRLRDWIFSRQRYWGEPIPLIHFEDGSIEAISYDELPLKLPAVESISSSKTGESPLANITDWVNIIDPKTGRKGRRETHTMPQWAGSCWYYLRYIDPHNKEALIDPEKERYWMPVDTYIGGVEHAVLHLLYARFWHKVLYDLGIVSTKEPFYKLVNQGMILGENGEKMSKSRNNVVNPDDIVSKYGADTLRIYEMFMGPFEAAKPWDTNGVEGVYRFLGRVFRLIDQWVENGSNIGNHEPTKMIRHCTIKKVTSDIELLRFNTAVSQLMVYVNELYKTEDLSKEDIKTLIVLLSPFAPHLSEECWELLGHNETISFTSWPDYVEEFTQSDIVTIAIQINGKLRGQVQVACDISSEDAIALAKSHENVDRYIKDKSIQKSIYVKGKLVSFVVK